MGTNGQRQRKAKDIDDDKIRPPVNKTGIIEIILVKCYSGDAGVRIF